MLAKGIPQVAVVMGSCTAGGADAPAMSDETVIVKNHSTIFLGWPAAGEGGHRRGGDGGRPRRRRCSHPGSGVADHLAENDAHALYIARRIVSNLNRTKADQPGTGPGARSRCTTRKRIYGIIPSDTLKPFDVREIIARVVDGSRFDEFKARYGTTLVTGFAQLHGYPVGIVANNGILFGESAQKGAHFIELCGQRGIPLLFLQNITGFMVGRKYENGGIAKDGAKMVTAVATVQVPKITTLDRRQLRRWQLRHVRPRLQPALPVDVAQRAHQRDGRRTGGQRAVHRAPRRHRGQGRQLEQGRGGGLQGADPRPVRSPGPPLLRHRAHVGRRRGRPGQTRRILGLTLSAALNAPIQPATKFGVFRM